MTATLTGYLQQLRAVTPPDGGADGGPALYQDRQNPYRQAVWGMRSGPTWALGPLGPWPTWALADSEGRSKIVEKNKFSECGSL